MYKISTSLRKKRDKEKYVLVNFTNKEMIIYSLFLFMSLIPIGFCYLFNKNELTNISFYVIIFNVFVIGAMQTIDREKIWHKIFYGFVFMLSRREKHMYKNITKFDFLQQISKKIERK